MKNRFLVPSIFAYLAFIIAIIAIIIGTIAYIQSPNTTNTANISGIPGQTDVTGNMSVTGQLNLPTNIPATSSESGSLIVAGGIGSNDSIYSKDGFFGPSFTSKSGSLNIGTKNQTGIVMGRDGFPIELKANQLIIECDSNAQTVFPNLSNSYDLGQKAAQWRDIFTNGKMFNGNLFPTKTTGGIFAQLEDSSVLSGIINPAGSILASSAEFTTTEMDAFSANTFSEGDTIKFEACGNLNINVVATTVNFSFYLGATVLVNVDLVVSGLTPPVSKTFIFTGSFTVRTIGDPGNFVANASVKWDSFSNENIGTLGASTFEDLIWDIRVKSESPGIGSAPGGIKSQMVNLIKIY